MPPDIQRGVYVLHFTCHFCGAFYHAAQLLHAVGIRRRIRCHETLTCFHIIIFPCALSCTHSRKPLTRKQPESLPVASLLRQESCDRDFRPSPAARGSPRCSPLLLSSGCSLPRACRYILPSCTTGNPCTRCVLNHDERYFWPYSYRKPETGVSSQLCK